MSKVISFEEERFKRLPHLRNEAKYNPLDEIDPDFWCDDSWDDPEPEPAPQRGPLSHMDMCQKLMDTISKAVIDTIVEQFPITQDCEDIHHAIICSLTAELATEIKAYGKVDRNSMYTICEALMEAAGVQNVNKA